LLKKLLKIFWIFFFCFHAAKVNIFYLTEGDKQFILLSLCLKIFIMKKGETFDIDWKPLALLFVSHLSEKDRRLFCGLEAVRLGAHGVSQVSSSYHIHPHTVRVGKAELLSGNLLPSDQVRRPGGGRKKKPL
jgi:hypothetical protein